MNEKNTSSPSPERRKLVIDRAIWLRGGGSGSGMLRTLAEPVKMCCLGIYLDACGIPRDELAGLGRPSDLMLGVDKGRVAFPDEARWLLRRENRRFNSEAAVALYQTNDSSQLTAAQREEALRRIFAQHGVDVEFAGVDS